MSYEDGNPKLHGPDETRGATPFSIDAPVFRWQPIDKWTDVMKVPGGWVVRTTVVNVQHGTTVEQTYVPDTRN